MGLKVSKIVRKPKHDENINLKQAGGVGYVGSSSSPQQKISILMSPGVALFKAALKGDWDAAKNLLEANKSLMTSTISDGGETALHISDGGDYRHFVSELLGMMGKNDDMEIPNLKGCTALCFAAAAGHTHIAELMVDRNPSLPAIKHGDGVRPLYMAALQGFRETAHFLYPKSAFESWTLQEQINLLTAAIDSQLYGLAMTIVKQHQGLAVAKDGNGETPMLALARNPLAFRRNSNGQGRRLWIKMITTVAPCMKSKRQDMDADAYALLDCMWNAAQRTRSEDLEAAAAGAANTAKLFFIAAESGNDDFLVELIARDPNFLNKVNQSRHSIFHIAVLRRYVKVFNLIYELGGYRDMIAAYIDTDGNNILHLAAKLAPQDQLNSVPGAALQMQREVLWYKEVEKLVRPSYRNKKNHAGQTPHELFVSAHGELMKEGEKFMKQTAKACMLVTMLIATVIFTTAFTVPGGYDNNTGVPILENKKLFMIFPVSEAAATLSSLTSMLMFLSILTSSYSDDDFLRALPFWLVVGVATLFVSIVAMMVPFCTCLLFFEHGGAAVILLLVFFGSVPTMFVVLKYPLLVTILRCTYSCTWLFRSYHRLHS